MTSLDAQCRSASAIVASAVLEDDHWRVFGYKRRPRRGAFFLRWVPAPKLELETTLLQEQWAAAVATIVWWGAERPHFSNRVAFMAKLVEYCLDGVREPLWPALGFRSRNEAVSFLSTAIREYLQAARADHPAVFLRRCAAQLTQPLPPTWLVGAAWLFVNSNSWVANAARAVELAGVADNADSDIVGISSDVLSMIEALYSNGEA